MTESERDIIKLKEENIDINNVMIVKENRYRIYTKEEIIEVLSGVIEDTRICYQNKYYRITKGIPQGCCISPLLCNIYLWLVSILKM